MQNALGGAESNVVISNARAYLLYLRCANGNVGGKRVELLTAVIMLTNTVWIISVMLFHKG